MKAKLITRKKIYGKEVVTDVRDACWNHTKLQTENPPCCTGVTFHSFKYDASVQMKFKKDEGNWNESLHQGEVDKYRASSNQQRKKKYYERF